MSLLARLAPIVWLSLLLCSRAHAQAQPAGGDEVEIAKQHYKRASRLFDLQRYAEAAHEYEAAYEAKDDPAFLYNIGQAYRLAGDYEKAIRAYKTYLLRAHDERHAAQIQARILDLQRLVDEQRRTHDAPPNDTKPPPGNQVAVPGSGAAAGEPAATAPTPAPVKPARRWRWLAIGLLAGGGAALVAGATLTGLAYQIQSEQGHPQAGTAYDPAAAERMRAEQASGGALLGVGAAAAVAGAVVLWVGHRSARAERMAAGPLLAPGAAGLVLTGVMP
jgi:tetratricopeptide (TPR) repeat protein